MQTVATNLPSAQPLVALDVYATDRSTGMVDGILVHIDLDYDPPAPEIGLYSGQFDGGRVTVVRLRNRAAWDKAHPGCEPTEAAMAAIVASVADELVECAVAKAEAEERDYESDEGDY